MSKLIAVDAGHGLHTAGKRTPDGEREWSFNNRVVIALIDELHRLGLRTVRLDDPSGQRDVPLAERTRKANNAKADVLVSVHHNANTGKWGTWTGTETYSHPKPTEGAKLSKVVHAEMIKAYGLRDRKTKTANFHMLRESKMPAILTEGGYMDSRIDVVKLRDNKVLKQAGINIAKGVAVYLGIPYKEEVDMSKPSSWAEKQWNWAAKQGLVTNNPKDNMTREQGIAILHSYHTMNSGGQPSEWAKPSWNWAQKQGYMNGKNPKESITRQELAAVLKSSADKNNLK